MKLYWPLLIVVILAMVSIRRGSSLAAHRDENLKLAGQLATVDVPLAAPDSINGAVPVVDKTELQSLGDEASRVHRLRGEVTLAQQRFDNLAPTIAKLAAKLRARTNQTEREPAPEFPPGYIPRHELADRGNATPDAALETFWWALSHGNGPRLFSVTAEMAGQTIPEDATGGNDSFMYMFRSFPGYRISTRGNAGSNQVVLRLETAPGAKVVDMVLIATNGQWLVSASSLENAF